MGFDLGVWLAKTFGPKIDRSTSPLPSQDDIRSADQLTRQRQNTYLDFGSLDALNADRAAHGQTPYADEAAYLAALNQIRSQYGLVPLTARDSAAYKQQAADERNAVTAELKNAALGMMSGKNVPTAQSVYDPQIATLRQNAVNLSGSHAADLARRGMAYSGAADKAVRDVGTQLAADTANAKTQATSQVQGWQRDSYNQGADFLKTAEDQNVSMDLLREAKKRAQQMNDQAWSNSGSIFG